MEDNKTLNYEQEISNKANDDFDPILGELVTDSKIDIVCLGCHC